MSRKLLSTQNPKSILGAWLFAAFWCAISFTVFWAFAFQARDVMGGTIGGLFSLLGVVMLYSSAKMTLEYFKYGRVDLRLENEPATGGALAARLEWPGDGAGAMTVQAELACVQTTWSRGSKGGPSKSERDVWTQKKVFPVRGSSIGGSAALTFDVPAGQPASDMPEELAPDAMVEAGLPAGVEIGHSYYRWEVRVKADVPGIDLDRTYKVRVAQGSGVPVARPVAVATPARFNPVTAVRRDKSSSFGGVPGWVFALAAIGFFAWNAWDIMRPARDARPATPPVQAPSPARQDPAVAAGAVETTETRLVNELAALDREGRAGSSAAGLAHYRLSQQHERQNRIAAQEQELLRALAILESHPVSEVKKALGPDGAWLDKEVVARRLGDFYWDRRDYLRAYQHYDRAYRYVPEIPLSDSERNRRLARNSAGRMAGACTQGDWAVADQAMKELKERIVNVDAETRKQLEYWIRTGEPRLAARQC